MAEKFAEQIGLEGLLQQSAAYLNAKTVALYLTAPGGRGLEFALAIPHENAADHNLAEAAYRSEKTARGETEGIVRLYRQLPGPDGHALGVLGVHIPAEGYTANLNQAFRFICNLAASLISQTQGMAESRRAGYRLERERDFLIKIYEAVQHMDNSEDPLAQLELVAQTFRDMGWSPVRATLRDENLKQTKVHIEGADAKQLPNISAATLQQVLTESEPYFEDAHYLDQIDANPLVLIPVRTPDGSIAATVELWGASSPPPVEDVRPLLIFARQYGQTLDRANLIGSLRQTASLLAEQVDELEFIRKADREISSRLDSNRIVKFSLDWAMRRTTANAGAVVTIDPIEHDVIVKEILGYPSDIVRHEKAKEMPGVVGRCLRTAETQLVDDVSVDPDYVAVLPITVTQIAIPLISNRRILGAITLESRRAGCFDQAAIEFLERIASMTAIALDNAHLLQQAEQLADDMSLIYNAGRTISTSLEWENTIKSVAQGMTLAVRGTSAMVYDYSPHSQSAQLQSVYTGSDAGVEKPEGIPAIGTRWNLVRLQAVLKTIDANRMLIIDKDTPDGPEKEWFKSFEANAIGIVPFTAGGEPVGLAIVLKSGLHLRFEQSEIFVAESLATQAGGVMRQASLYEDIRQLETLKSEMIRMASHDLKGPLNNAMGYLELLEEDLGEEPSDAMQMYVTSIRRSIQAMESLIQDLLTLEKVESQNKEAWEDVNLSALVNAVVDEQQATARLSQQILTVHLPEQAVHVRGSTTQLRQAITNLVNNGLKYTPKEGNIQVRAYLEEGNRIYFETMDNGYGIPKDRQAKIFDRFYRAKQPGTEHITGTGLGLSLVKTIIERHGGQITFESDEGRGSTFTFWLPRARL